MEAETESTGTATSEELLCGHPTRDTLAEGLMGLLKPTLDRLEECVRATRQSQVDLRRELEAVLEELANISDAQKDCPELEEYVKKLLNSKQRITVVSAILQSSQERLNRIHQMASKDVAKRSAVLDDSSPSASTSASPAAAE